MVWNIAEFITHCINKRGINPGAHVGLDLLLGLGLITNAVFNFAWYNLYDGTCNGHFCGEHISGSHSTWLADVVGSVFIVFALYPIFCTA
jgi:hypothetical protein